METNVSSTSATRVAIKSGDQRLRPSRNVANVLGLMGPEGALAPDWDDEIVTGMCVLREGAGKAPAAVELLGSPGGAPATGGAQS